MKSVIEVYSEISKENPPWTPEEEKEFIDKWWQKDREHFVNEALKHNLGIVFKSMQKVAFNPKNEDAFQKAVIALADALRRFNPDKKMKISTWVTNPVRWAIQQFQNPYNHQGSICDEIVSLNNRYGMKMSVVSIDAKVKDGDGDGDTVGELLTDTDINNDFLFGIYREAVQDEIDKNVDMKESVAEMLAYMPRIMTKNEQYVINRILKGKNMSDISLELKLSRMRVGQIASKAFEKIRRSKFGKRLKGLVEQ